MGSLQVHNNDPNAEPTEFKGRRILVTGGTRGIGEAIVDRLIRGGGDVIATARSVSPETSADRFVQADVSAREGIETVVKAVTDRFKGLDILIHNVGFRRDHPRLFNPANTSAFRRDACLRSRKGRID
jgi:NAD(P)-dependent dehydrogenase (short-subunit alcohol dehydrogenase family)